MLAGSACSSWASSCFGVASLGQGCRSPPPVAVLGRLVPGFAAGVWCPHVLATVRSLFAGPERASVFAVYGAIAGSGRSRRASLGGVLTDANLFGWGWRTVFLVNVPVAAVVLVAGAR